MKTAILILALLFTISTTVTVEAKSAYYKSAKTGQFTSKSYSKAHKATTYKSYRK
jgi:hypothetical protein